MPPVRGFSGPLDAWAELTAVLRDLPEDERRHFLTKAQGGELRGDSDALGELTWHFTGREDERHEVLTRMRPGHPVVVTGRAGSGKSAILGDLVVRSRPKLAKVLLDRKLIEPAFDQIPQFDAALQLTGLDVAEVMVRLSELLDLSPPAPDLPLTAQVDDFITRLGNRPTPARIVVDALDEAVAPLQVAAALRRIGATPQVELIVGTRRSTKEGPDQPDPPDRDLLDALGVGEDAVRVERRKQLAFRYVCSRLRSLEVGCKVTSDQVATAAREIAEVDQEFLYARLTTYELLAQPTLATKPNLIDQLGTDHRSVFAGAVARRAGKFPPYRPLLVALALAQGRGVPIRDGVWAAVASALRGRGIAEQVIHHLLKDAAPYLALDRDHNQTVYRLAHRTFAEHLTADPARTKARHTKIVTRALREVTRHGEASNPYWLHQTTAHCAAAGLSAWRQLDQSPSLDFLDPTAVARDAMRSLFGRGPVLPNIASGIFAASSLRSTAPSERRVIRRLAPGPRLRDFP